MQCLISELGYKPCNGWDQGQQGISQTYSLSNFSWRSDCLSSGNTEIIKEGEGKGNEKSTRRKQPSLDNKGHHQLITLKPS